MAAGRTPTPRSGLVGRTSRSAPTSWPARHRGKTATSSAECARLKSHLGAIALVCEPTVCPCRAIGESRSRRRALCRLSTSSKPAVRNPARADDKTSYEFFGEVESVGSLQLLLTQQTAQTDFQLCPPLHPPSSSDQTLDLAGTDSARREPIRAQVDSCLAFRHGEGAGFVHAFGDESPGRTQMACLTFRAEELPRPLYSDYVIFVRGRDGGHGPNDRLGRPEKTGPEPTRAQRPAGSQSRAGDGARGTGLLLAAFRFIAPGRSLAGCCQG